MTSTFDHLVPGTPEAAWHDGQLDRLLPVAELPADADLLVIAAHPDDETLGAGGLTATAAARGARVHVIVATDGEASPPRSPTHSPRQLAHRRRAETTEALRLLAPSTGLEFLGLPDGGLSTAVDALSKAVATRLAGCTNVITPWRRDGHPDHEACAHTVTTLLGRRPPVRHWEYPIWAWHWATPLEPADTGLPWPQVRRLDLTSNAAAAKNAALACHVSQHAPLSDAPGDEPILPPGILAHFQRGFETFVIETNAPAAEAAYFDRLYERTDDPWGLAERFYEIRKRNLVLASLPRAPFARAFEPGCATGQLTAELATRCDEVLAWDGAVAAVRQAREHAAMSNVRVEQRRIPDEWPAGRFDLIVLSEVGYYCPDLTLLLERIEASLTDDGVLLACHWSHPAPDDPHTARQVHDALATLGRRPIVRHREADFLLDVWSSRETTIAEADGIDTGETAR